MPVAEMHHGGPDSPLKVSAFDGAVLLLICAAFFWKLVLTNQFTWLENPDIAYQVMPWYQFQAGEWHDGKFPLWDPYAWGGQPLLGQAQPGAAYPVNWILFLLPLRNGWLRQGYLHWYFVLIHWMAALFCYLLLRDLGRSRAASIIAGAVFALGGYLGGVDWPQMLNGAVWAPLVFLFLLRAFRGQRPFASGALGGMFLGISLLSGHHQIPIFIALACGGVALYYLFRRGKPNWRLLPVLALFLLFAGLTSGLQSFPAYEYGRLAHRWVGLDTPVSWGQPVPYSVHSNYSLHPISVLGIVLPGIQLFASPHVGLVALLLVVLALALEWADESVRIFTFVAIFSLLFSFGSNTLFHGLIYSLIPLVEKARSPAAAIVIFHFGMCVLIAYGIDQLSAPESSRWLVRIKRTALGFAILVYGTLLVLAVAGKASFAMDGRVAVTALVAILFAALLSEWQKNRLGWKATNVSMLALILIELGNVSGIGHLPVGDQRAKYLKKMAEDADVVEFLRHQPQPFRVEVDSQVVPHNFGDWYGIDVYGGYLASLSSNLLPLGLHSQGSHKLFGVRYTLTTQPKRPDAKSLFEGASGLKVYFNPDALPRVWTVHEAVQVHGEDEIKCLIEGNGIDLRRTTFLHERPPELARCGSQDEVHLLRRESDRVTISAWMACRGMVVLSDTYFPGWEAEVDGTPVPIYEADTAIRGVVVDHGTHIVEMRYRPHSVYVGAISSAAGILGALLIWLFGYRRRKMRKAQ
jgi:hypothetical protein